MFGHYNSQTIGRLRALAAQTMRGRRLLGAKRDFMETLAKNAPKISGKIRSQTKLKDVRLALLEPPQEFEVQRQKINACFASSIQPKVHLVHVQSIFQTTPAKFCGNVLMHGAHNANMNVRGGQPIPVTAMVIVPKVLVVVAHAHAAFLQQFCMAAIVIPHLPLS